MSAPFILPTRHTRYPALRYDYQPTDWRMWGNDIHAASAHGNNGLFLDLSLASIGASGGFIAEALGHPGDR